MSIILLKFFKTKSEMNVRTRILYAYYFLFLAQQWKLLNQEFEQVSRNKMLLAKRHICFVTNWETVVYILSSMLLDIKIWKQTSILALVYEPSFYSGSLESQTNASRKMFNVHRVWVTMKPQQQLKRSKKTWHHFE